MRQGKTNWSKPFPVKSVTREDIFTAGFPRFVVAGISDAEMEQIVAQMGVSSSDSFFLDDLGSATKFVLCKRQGANIIGEPV